MRWKFNTAQARELARDPMTTATELENQLRAACDEIDALKSDLGGEENETHWLKKGIEAIQAHCIGSAPGEEGENLEAIEKLCDWALRKEKLCDCAAYLESGACEHTTGII